MSSLHCRPFLTLSLLSFLAGCGSGEWKLETWGEEYIEEGIPQDVFEDGCSLVYDAFLVTFTSRALMDGDGQMVGEIGGSQVYDLTLAGPTAMGTVEVPATHYSSVHATVGPAQGATSGNASEEQLEWMNEGAFSVHVEGTLTCGGMDKAFSWDFATLTAYACEPEDLTIPAGGSDTSQLTIHGDHLFYDGLENPDAVVRGQAIFDADADGSGTITQEELAQVSVASLGYDVGQYGEVATLEDFVTFLTQTLGHIDGEGHCQVDL